MIKIEFPQIKPAVKCIGNDEKIFCIVRKKWLQITPEEWVRQNFLLYLIYVKGYPQALLSIEKKLQVGEMIKRYDVVVFGTDFTSKIAIECKEMNVVLNKSTVMQLIHYNSELQAPYLLITNGSTTYGFRKIKNNFEEIMEVPSWAFLMGLT